MTTKLARELAPSDQIDILHPKSPDAASFGAAEILQLGERFEIPSRGGVREIQPMKIRWIVPAPGDPAITWTHLIYADDSFNLL